MIKRNLVWFSMAALLAGCHSHHRVEDGYSRCDSNGHCSSEIRRHYHDHGRKDVVTPLPTAQPSAANRQHGWAVPYQYVTSLQSNKQLNDYVAQMAMQLVETFHYFPVESRVAVASFVDLDSELNRTNVVGNQLAEAFIHQLQQFGVNVVDFKTTRDIQVTANGDFVFSRNHSQLDALQQIDYVLSGTMVFGPRGIMINARVINFRTKVVAASSQQLIPHFVISSLYPGIVR
ncbi:FlgO family outer membrane protein [Alishewanella longhuensis]